MPTINKKIMVVSSMAKPSKIDFAVGGQAVIEGVMMRSPNTIVISVRKKNGSIIVKDRVYRTFVQRYCFLNFPILRGMINLVEMMVVGSKAINFSANEYVEESGSLKSQASNLKFSSVSGAKLAKTTIKLAGKEPHKTASQKFFDAFMFVFSLVCAIALTLLLFKFLPLWITTFLESNSPTIKNNYMIFNFIDGVIKTSFFILYIFFLSLIPSFKRIFEYHGAEHKAVFTYEASLPLTVENARKQSRFHPRCGTSFILIVFALSILVYTFLPRQPNFWDNLALRIAFLPVIAGISYEYLKISARYTARAWTKILVAPGLWLQRLTTREPANDQLEVALNSLKIALEKEKKIRVKPS